MSLATQCHFDNDVHVMLIRFYVHGHIILVNSYVPDSRAFRERRRYAQRQRFARARPYHVDRIGSAFATDIHTNFIIA
jgi:hypothetical protein